MKPIYYGIFLDDESKTNLIQTFSYTIPKDWTLYMDHVTIVFGEPSLEMKEYINDNFGKTIELEITSFGVSSEAMAVEVKGNFQCVNEHPHITLATPNDGKPYNSNKIKWWMKISTNYKLKGTIDSYPRNSNKEEK